MNKRLLMVGVPTIGAVALMQVMATGAPAQVQPTSSVGADRVTADSAYPSGVTWNTPFVIQNLGTGTATVVVDFYTIGSGAKALSFSAGTIAAGASLPVRPANISGLQTNQKYSVVISSDQPVGAVVNEAATNRLMSYIGATSGAGTVYLPNITKNYAGYNTVLYIQNVGTSNLTDVSVKFTPFGAGSAVTKTYSLNAGASVEIDPTTVAELTDNTQYSAVVSSATTGASLAAVVNQVAPVEGTEAAYSGFTSGSTTLYAPNVVRHYASFNSPVVAQNVGTAATNLTIDYYYGQSFGGSLFGTLAKSYTTKPDGSAITLQPGESYPERSHSRSDLQDGQYSMVIRSSAAPIVSIVNQVDQNDNTKAASYDGFAAGSKKINLPNIVRNYATYQSPIVVQNIGTQSTTVTVNYYYGERAQSGPSFKDQGLQGQLAASETATIAAGANQPFRIHNLSALSGKDGQYSAIVTSSTSDIVAIVSQVSVPSIGGSGHEAASYEGINQ